MSSGEISDREPAVVVQNATLREWLAETIVKRHVGVAHPDDAIPIPRRVGTVRHRLGFSITKQDAWFPVRDHEVDRARLRAFRAGVTCPTYMDFHLLRRNYEADPNSIQRGVWMEVQRDPRPSFPRILTLTWMNSGISLIAIVDELDRIDPENVAEPDEMRLLIRSIIADMCRPLAPRRGFPQQMR